MRVSLRSEKLCHTIFSCVSSTSCRFPEFRTLAKEALVVEEFQSIDWLASESWRYPWREKVRVAPWERMGLVMLGHHRGVLLESAVIQMQRRYWLGPRDLKPKVRFPLAESQKAEEGEELDEEEGVEALVGVEKWAFPALYSDTEKTPWELENRRNRRNRGGDMRGKRVCIVF